MEWLKRHPWIFVPVFFLILIAGWIAILTIAAKNQPEKIPLETRPSVTETSSEHDS